ncbi:hypothetical protein [Hymenobacter sp. GOD-10R]|uniref:hypothetical protein n=1 Tax=Hymenobacter sp. GOD-10R TaxID=3093922 RepID=UPI002D783CDA|nr:hypothetical protein [Hymenobacter sp. GOD-10R]WRQ31739.1 hypothetical protein SD425_28930 [Hymenobacter sp. GOD-10R]
MKKRSTLSALLFTFLLSCWSYASPTPNRTPLVAKHLVEVRITGQNLVGLGAELTVRSVLNWKQGYNPGHSFTQSFTEANVSQTYKVGNFDATDYVEAAITLKNVTRDSRIQPAVNSFLKIEIITDGKVGETTQLDANAKGWKVEYDPHLRAIVSVDAHQW